MIRPALAFVALASVLAPDVAFGCSCIRPEAPCEAFQKADAVFVAKVQSGKTNDGASIDFNVLVSEAFSGNPGDEAIVRTVAGTSMCGYPFEIGRTYLVYAWSESSGRYTTTLCSRTRPLDGAEDDLLLLRQMQKGQVIGRTFGQALWSQLRVEGWFARTDSMGPVAGIEILAHGTATPLRTTTDRGGRFVFEGLVPGRYEIEARWPTGLHSRFEARKTVDVGQCGAPDVFLFAISEAPLSGTVRGPDGSPLGKDVVVTVVRTDSSGAFRMDPKGHSTFAFTDDKGRWVLDGLPPGRYLVGLNLFGPPTMSSPYLASYHPPGTTISDAMPIDVEAGRQVTVELKAGPPLRARTIAGLALDEKGLPIKGAFVRVYDSDFPGQLVDGTHANTDDAGKFSLPALEGRRYLVQVTVYKPERREFEAEVEPFGDVVGLKLMRRPR